MSRLALTEGDVEVFRWLWMLRVMTLEQIRRVRYYQSNTGRLSSLDNVRKRLKRLWDAGYFAGDILLQTNERLYYLGSQALPALRDHLGIDQRRLYKPRAADTMQQLLHPLMVSECAVRFTEAIRRTDVETPELAPLWVSFYHTHAVGDARRKKHVERFVTQEDIAAPGHPEPLRIRPDLVFALAKGADGRLFFLEADRGSEGPKEIAAKQLGYAHYQQASNLEEPARYRWQRYGDMRDFRVLFVTTHRRRVDLLRRYLREKPGFGLMAFATFEELKECDPVFEPIWVVASGEKKALLKQSCH